MKKIGMLLLAAFLAVMPLAAGTAYAAEETITLKVANWEDYIATDDDGEEILLRQFEQEMSEKYGATVVVEYSVFGTNEDLYNELKIANGYAYDVICPSDYMIEKMAKEGMLQKLSLPADSNYETYMSEYIKDIFSNKITWEGATLADYAVCYMWGTMGYVYNPANVSHEDMKDWTSLWDEKYAGKSTIKDSVRDSYFVGIAYAKEEKLLSLKAQYDEGAITPAAYNAELTRIFNDTSVDTVNAVEKALSALKKNIFGFEVDSGKNDIASGTIDINFAWSGDAVYAMDEAEELGVELYYSVPETGSNIWFDGWCIPKDAEQAELAAEFIDFMCAPENAIANMDYVGYTSGVAGNAVFERMVETYGLLTEPADGYTEVDLSYFFGNDDAVNGGVVYTDVIGRQFSAQYPDTGITDRCVVMNYFDDEANERINTMWENIKGVSFPAWAIVLIVVGVLLIVGIVLLIRFKDKIFRGGKGKKGVKVVEKEEA